MTKESKDPKAEYQAGENALNQIEALLKVAVAALDAGNQGSHPMEGYALEATLEVALDRLDQGIRRMEAVAPSLSYNCSII